MKTLYDLIGARRDDDAEGLKKAYRQAAKANHPDYHAGDPEAARRFMRIAAAYDILRDTGQRAAYDRILASRRQPPEAPSPPAAPPWRRSFVSGVGVTAAAAVMLGAAFVLFARSGGAIEDGAGRTSPPVSATGTADPAVAASTAADRSTPQHTGTARQTAPAQARPPLDAATRDVDPDLVDLTPAPERPDGVPASPSSGPWMARRHPASDLRPGTTAHGQTSAGTLPPPKKPAPRPGPGNDDAVADPKPDSLRLGSLCLSLDSRGCPAAGDQQRP